MRLHLHLDIDIDIDIDIASSRCHRDSTSLCTLLLKNGLIHRSNKITKQFELNSDAFMMVPLQAQPYQCPAADTAHFNASQEPVMISKVVDVNSHHGIDARDS